MTHTREDLEKQHPWLKEEACIDFTSDNVLEMLLIKSKLNEKTTPPKGVTNSQAAGHRPNQEDNDD